MYWLFKYFMKKLIKDFKESYDKEISITRDISMRPDFYQLERFLDNKLGYKK